MYLTLCKFFPAHDSLVEFAVHEMTDTQYPVYGTDDYGGVEGKKADEAYGNTQVINDLPAITQLVDKKKARV